MAAKPNSSVALWCASARTARRHHPCSTQKMIAADAAAPLAPTKARVRLHGARRVARHSALRLAACCRLCSSASARVEDTPCPRSVAPCPWRPSGLVNPGGVGPSAGQPVGITRPRARQCAVPGSGLPGRRAGACGEGQHGAVPAKEFSLALPGRDFLVNVTDM